MAHQRQPPIFQGLQMHAFDECEFLETRGGHPRLPTIPTEPGGAFWRSQLGARNWTGQTPGPPPLRNALVMLWVDESQAGYTIDPERFNEDLDAYHSAVGSEFGEIRQPAVLDVNDTHGDSGNIWPLGTEFPFDDFRLWQFRRNFRPGPDSFYSSRNQAVAILESQIASTDREGLPPPGHFLLSVDNSGSMRTENIEPGFLVPDHNDLSLVQYIETNYPQAEISISYPIYLDGENWIREIMQMLRVEV